MIASARALDLPVFKLFGDSLLRMGMSGVLVLSLVPMLRAGVGINYGMPVGILAGLVGVAISIEFKLTGFIGLLVALVLACVIAIPVGYLYALLLNRVKENEEIVGTFLGFSIVYLMCIFWAKAPFSNPKMLWPIGGYGVRPTVNLDFYFGKILNNFLAIDIGGILIPVSLLIALLCGCGIVSAYGRTRDGLTMKLVGLNERFTRVFGADVDKIRIKAVVQSTAIGAIGIVIYAQTYGFLQLYDAPLMMAFPAAAAILIGGYSGRQVTIAHVLLGTLILQTMMVFSTPVANELLVPELAEVLRLIVTNGVILYALLYEKDRSKV
jgi:simple sugar transport system permease protein